MTINCDSVNIAGSNIEILYLLGLPLQDYCDAIAWNIYACLKGGIFWENQHHDVELPN